MASQRGTSSGGLDRPPLFGIPPGLILSPRNFAVWVRSDNGGGRGGRGVQKPANQSFGHHLDAIPGLQAGAGHVFGGKLLELIIELHPGSGIGKQVPHLLNGECQKD